MARLLVKTKLEYRGDIVSVHPNDYVFGTNEDITRHRLKYGDTTRWSGNFVIVDLPDMALAEAERLLEEVVTSRDGPISRGNIDYDGMANTEDRQDKLADNYKVERNASDVMDKIAERVAA